MVLRFWSKKTEFNYFRAVKAILDVAVPAIAEERGISEDEIRRAMIPHLKCFSTEYRTGKKPQNDYPDPLCRLAYLYCYVPANANLCEIAIKRTDELAEFVTGKLKKKGELKVCAFGGGPGTELLALTKFLINNRKNIGDCEISFILLDEVEEWVESWNLIESEVRNFLKKSYGKPSSWPFLVSKSFIPFDITSLDRYGNLKHLFGQDLYILNYVVSEIYERDELAGLSKVLKTMIKSADSGAKILIIDRNEWGVVNKVKELMAELGVDVSEVQETKENMDYDEESSELGVHYIREHAPRLTWNSFWITGTKK
jgi:hypothetical protein